MDLPQFKEFQDFWNLTDEVKLQHLPDPPAIMLGMFSPYVNGSDEFKKKVEENYNTKITELKVSVEAHSVYIWLNSYLHYKIAFITFEKKCKGNDADDFVQKVRFIYILSKNLGLYFWKEKINYDPPTPDSIQIKKALGYVQKLRAQMKGSGIRLKDFQQSQELESLLGMLEDELEGAKRKSRKDDTWRERELISGTARQLLDAFGEASPAILSDVAALVDYTNESKTLDHILKEERKAYEVRKRERAKALAFALQRTLP